eukprot:8168066-Karenia_brevis.AAC.1
MKDERWKRNRYERGNLNVFMTKSDIWKMSMEGLEGCSCLARGLFHAGRKMGPIIASSCNGIALKATNGYIPCWHQR